LDKDFLRVQFMIVSRGITSLCYPYQKPARKLLA